MNCFGAEDTIRQPKTLQQADGASNFQHGKLAAGQIRKMKEEGKGIQRWA